MNLVTIGPLLISLFGLLRPVSARGQLTWGDACSNTTGAWIWNRLWNRLIRDDSKLCNTRFGLICTGTCTCRPTRVWEKDPLYVYNVQTRGNCVIGADAPCRRGDRCVSNAMCEGVNTPMCVCNEGYQAEGLRCQWKSTLDAFAAASSLHLLDPLTKSEINATTSIIKEYQPDNWRFIYITLQEPEKSLLLPYFLTNTDPPAGTIPRKSFVLLVDAQYNQAHEVVVNLDTSTVESWTDSPPGVQLPFTPEESLKAEAIVRKNEEVVERCRQQGWTNMSLVNGDLWPIGYTGDTPQYQGKRIVHVFIYGKNFDNDNQYAHPFDFSAVVDLAAGRVISLDDLPTHEDYDASNKEGNSVPKRTANYEPELRDPKSFRRDLRPVNVSQPNGTSYTVNGYEIQWQKFKMRIGFNGREGVVVYNVNYNDNGNVRPLFYRMSVPEMFVLYGDPRIPYHRKYGFDVGQYGLGYRANVLESQVDCIGQVHFFDGILHNEKGQPKTVSKAICLHEEDTGILWKHTDFRTNKSPITRSQRLALTSVVTAGNYDFVITWYFYQDASIEYHTKLTGILSTNLFAVNASPAGHGTIVIPQINAQYHQHFFTLRLDAEVDGNNNSVVVQDVEPMSMSTGSMENPYGQGFTTRNTLLRTAGAGRTNISPENSRTWHIKNPSSLNPITKEPVGWRLMPWTSPPLLLQLDSPIHPTVGYLDYNTWVTPYKEDQRYPGGLYLNSSGLPEWVGQDENANIDNTDIVLWHNFQISHIPRVEDFPVMPFESVSVVLKPVNFFNGNPALDVPPPSPPPTASLRDEL